MTFHYVIDAASLLEQCLDELTDVLDVSSAAGRSDYQLYDLREVLILTERLLTAYAQVLLKQSVGSSVTTMQRIQSASGTTHHLSCLASCIDLLKKASENEQETFLAHGKDIIDDESGSLILTVNSYYSKRNPTDSLLFRLIVALQLCTTRIGDARLVITGRRCNEAKNLDGPSSSPYKVLPTLVATCCAVAFVAKSYDRSTRKMGPITAMPFSAAIQAGLGLVSAYWLKNRWANMWVTAKVVKTIDEIQQWNYQWRLVQSTKRGSAEETESSDVKSQRLIDFALHETPRSTFWHSQGELRFLMLKRAMDVFYASVQTATTVTGRTSDDAIDWQVVLATAAVSSFYTLTGARQLAEQATSSSESARKLIQHSWGMVSWPALKTISLQASRLLKGAAIADRLEIAGVSCFVLSREPVPELKAASTRLSRTHLHRQTLSTIDEQEEHTPESLSITLPFAASCTRYRQRDIILHMTAGGFFTHTIASDLPYLLDWSAATGAVVLCPEYCLLPQHTFPDALHQVEAVYKAIQSGRATQILGFEVNRIVLTGESSGGNLAAALCVKLCMDADGTQTCLSSSERPHSGESVDNAVPTTDAVTENNVILPCAMVLSCPVLNLSLELSHSRVIGFQDPVLPTGLLSAISDAYLPRDLGIRKKDPLVSPLFASDSVLSRFPPTLVFASSTDPLLDDSVALNERLRRLGVESDLRAAQNLCHAFFGLGTAGFPEAKDVQQQLIEWLNFQLTRKARTGEGHSNEILTHNQR